MKKFQDVVASSIVVPAMTNARLVFAELSNTLIVSTSNKITTTVEFARDIASSIESKMPDYSPSAVVTLVKEQHTIFLLIGLLFALLSVLLIRYMPSDGFMSSGASQKKKKKNESVRVIKKIHSMVTIDTTATSSSSISNSSIAESSTQEEEDADTDYEDGVCFIDDDASCTGEIVRECIGEEPSMIPSIIINDTESDDYERGSSLRASPMRKLSRKLSSSNKIFKLFK